MHDDGTPRCREDALFPGSFVDQLQFDRARKRLETSLFLLKEQPEALKAHIYRTPQPIALRITDWQSTIDVLEDVLNHLNEPNPPRKLRKGRRVLAVGRTRWDNLSPPSAS
jgi:hypothetical protein